MKSKRLPLSSDIADETTTSSFIQKVEKGRKPTSFITSSKKPEEKFVSTCLWVTFALIAAVSYAVSNTLVGEMASLGGIVA